MEPEKFYEIDGHDGIFSMMEILEEDQDLVIVFVEIKTGKMVRILTDPFEVLGNIEYFDLI